MLFAKDEKLNNDYRKLKKWLTKNVNLSMM